MSEYAVQNKKKEYVLWLLVLFRGLVEVVGRVEEVVGHEGRC